MFKSFIFAATLATAAAATAAPAERIVTDGDHAYAYTVSSDTHGRIVVTGRDTGNGVPFRYVIDGRDVSGFTGNDPVSFRIAKPISAPIAGDRVAAR